MNRLPNTEEAAPHARALREELHGKRRDLHERLFEVCEEFIACGLTREHKQKALVRELRYLMDFYADDDTWREVD